MSILKHTGPINYDIEVWCHNCSEKHLKTACEFRVRYGWKCPWCGNKCRGKARYNKEAKDKIHPYITNRTPRYVTTELKELVKGDIVAYNKQRKLESNKQWKLRNPNYMKEYIRKYYQEHKEKWVEYKLDKEKARLV